MTLSFLRKSSALLFGFALLLSLNSRAQVDKKELIQDNELTLEEAIQVALANSPVINRALLSVKDADELVKIAYGDVFPDIVSSLGYTRNIEIPVQYIPAKFFDPDAPEGALAPVQFGTDNNWQGGFTVNQNIFKGEVLVGLSTSAIYKTVQQENFRATSQQVITQTRMAYYQVLGAREQLRLQETQIKRLEQNLKENRAREEAGLIDSYAVLQLEVQLSNQRPQLIEAQYAVDEAYRNLKIAMGLPLNLDFTILGNLNDFDIVSATASNADNKNIKEIDRMNAYSYQKEVMPENGLTDRRGDLRLLDAQLKLKDKEISAIKSRFLPVVTAQYNLQWSAAEPGTPNFFENSNRFKTLALNVSLPLFKGLKRVAEVQRAQIARKDLEEQKRLSKLNAENEVASAKEDLNKAFETAEGRRQALEQAQEGYERASKRFDNGLGSQLEVTEAEVQVRQAEVNYALMVLEYLNAKAQYDLATGMVPFVDTNNVE
ncbi:MAG: TolC family protein [Balneolaceae bacterium]|nr:TolC family protein [Balneolaceae bacterium]